MAAAPQPPPQLQKQQLLVSSDAALNTHLALATLQMRLRAAESVLVPDDDGGGGAPWWSQRPLLPIIEETAASLDALLRESRSIAHLLPKLVDVQRAVARAALYPTSLPAAAAVASAHRPAVEVRTLLSRSVTSLMPVSVGRRRSKSWVWLLCMRMCSTSRQRSRRCCRWSRG
jgi:hypothetical protein